MRNDTKKNKDHSGKHRWGLWLLLLFFFFFWGGGSGTDTGKLLTVEEKGDRTPPFCFHSGSTE